MRKIMEKQWGKDMAGAEEVYLSRRSSSDDNLKSTFQQILL